MIRPLALALLTLATAPAAAQTSNQCAPRDKVLPMLADRYGEARQAMGLAANNAVVELFANPDTGTWTIIGTLPSGLSCLLASGESFEAVAEVLIPGDGA